MAAKLQAEATLQDGLQKVTYQAFTVIARILLAESAHHLQSCGYGLSGGSSMSYTCCQQPLQPVTCTQESCFRPKAS